MKNSHRTDDFLPLLHNYVKGQPIVDGPLFDIFQDSFVFVKEYYGCEIDLVSPTIIYGGKSCMVYMDDSKDIYLADALLERPQGAVEEITHWLQHRKNPNLFAEKKHCQEENRKYLLDQMKNGKHLDIDNTPKIKRLEEIYTVLESTSAITQLWYADKRGILERVLQEDINPERADLNIAHYIAAYELARSSWRKFSNSNLRRQLLLAQSLQDISDLVN